MKKKITKNKKAPVKRLKTAKQKKLIKLISENLGGKKGGRTMKSMMLEAGYSESMANQQSSVLCLIKESKEFGDYIERLENMREKLMKRMEDTIDEASHSEVSASLARTENIILLASGRPTANVKILSEEDKEKMDSLFKDNS